MTPTGNTRVRKNIWGREIREIEVMVTVLEDFGPHGAGTCSSNVPRWMTEKAYQEALKGSESIGVDLPKMR
jgi:hypothetical protein